MMFAGRAMGPEKAGSDLACLCVLVAGWLGLGGFAWGAEMTLDFSAFASGGHQH